MVQILNGSGQIVSFPLSKHYINSIWTDNVIGYEAEEQVTATGTAKVTNRYYYHTNQLWSVMALSSSTWAILQKYVYDTYGKAYVYSWSTLIPLSAYTGSLYSNIRLYTGREYDREINLYYNRARHYNPDTGRFLSRDPIWQNDQVNLYTYVRNSPLMYTDRDGKAAKRAIASWWNLYLDVASYPWKVASNIEDKHFFRNSNSKNAYHKEQDAIKNGWTLQPDNRSIYHRFWEWNENNKKYLSPDWHEEVVFDITWKIVMDPTNEWTYNYGTNDFEHTLYDVIPYYIWWNDPNDKTSIWERLWKISELLR